MPISVDTPSWFSAIRADDKPVYLNPEGALKTGGSLKGRLVGIAESLGIFKDYVTSYRGREVVRNRDAYDAAWRFVNSKYGAVVSRYTREATEEQGYSRADSVPYVSRLRGHNPRDPGRAIVGRELRLILNTARGIDQALRREPEAAQQQYVGLAVQSDAEVAAQRQRWAVWTGPRQSDAEVATQSGAEAMETVAVPESPGNADGMADSLRDLKMSADNVFDQALGKSTVMLDATSQVKDSPAATPSPAISLPQPRKYKGVDYFDQSDQGISRLAVPIKNHQAAKQVVADDRYLAASMPEGHREDELTSGHRAYIKTTLLRHVAEHERTRPGILLNTGDLHRMMRPITARALGMQSGRKLGAKVLYKNVTKHLGRKDAAFGDEMKKLRRQARCKAAAKVNLSSFVQGVARKANIAIDIDSRVIRAIRPQVKDMAEAYVDDNRKALTEPVLEHIVQAALHGYSLVAVHAPMREFKW